MNYIDHLDLFGVEAKEIPCDTGSGAPTSSTVGAVGLFYMDTDNGDVYKCTAVSGGKYTWKLLNSSSQNSGGNAENGEDGFSPIAKVEQTATGAVISITDKTGTTTATITDGKDGKDGADGAPGEKGEKGDTGAPGADGAKGEKGDKGDTGATGAQGEPGKDGANGVTPHVGSNGNWFIGDNDTGIPATGPTGNQGLPGTPGEDGKDGKDGTSATHSWNGTVLTITSASGTSSADLKGAKGDKGDKGDTGATGAAGQPGANGVSPVRGVDYWTAADKQEIKKELVSEIITNEAGESESLVMSQKAVTELVSNALGSGNESVEYETVDSVEEMTDTSKAYVLSTTNTIWAYGETEVGTVREQIFDPSDMFAGHMSGTNISAGSGQKIYRIPTNTSVIPSGTDVYLDAIGLYPNTSTNTPKLMKIGYSSLDVPAVGSNQFVAGGYAQSGDTALGDGIISQTSNGCRIKFGYVAGDKISNYDTIKTTLLEISEDHDASKISVYIEYDGGTKSEWYDTGMVPSSGSGSNIAALLVKIDQNKSDIREVENRVTALESGSDIITVPTFWETAVNSVIAKIKALQVGRNCVTFPFFSDNHQRNGYSGVLIRKVMDECHIPFCFYGGDSIDSGYIASEAVMVEQDKKFDTMMSVVPNGRFCRAVGNHDGYWAVSANEKHYYTREQVYELFLREESIAQNKHFGDDGTYYYVDELASKVRFIVLNTNGGSVDDAQLAWFRDVALKVNEGWAVVVISHQPISNHYHSGISNAADVRAIVTESGVEMIGWFSGHIHRDRIYTGAATNTADDSEGTAMGFKQVTITSDHTGIAYDDATKHTVANDDQSHAIDFVTINRNTRTVNLTRLGIGEDRSYTY